jgi:hypothetical protein
MSVLLHKCPRFKRPTSNLENHFLRKHPNRELDEEEKQCLGDSFFQCICLSVVPKHAPETYVRKPHVCEVERDLQQRAGACPAEGCLGRVYIDVVNHFNTQHLEIELEPSNFQSEGHQFCQCVICRRLFIGAKPSGHKCNPRKSCSE